MKNRLFFIPAGVILLVLLIVGSVCDFNIAKSLFVTNNGFSRFMAAFAVVPLGICVGFVCGTLFKIVINKEYKKLWLNIILSAISFIVSIGGAYFFGTYFTSYHALNLSEAFAILFGLIPIAPGYLLGYLLYEKMNRKYLFRIYLLVAITVIFVVGMTNVLKEFLPRLRYTSIIEVGTNYFRPWYDVDFSLNKDFVKQFNLVNPNEIKSFPSGHSSAALMSAFTVMFIPKLFDKFKDKEVYFFYVGFLFFLLVAFSRILYGAHYLSDTMFAGVLALLVCFISNEIYLRKLVKE